MLFKVYLFLGLYVVFHNQIIYINGKAIIGDNVQKLKKKQFPFVVSLMRITSETNEVEKNHICTGALVSRKDVLTSAHCLDDEETTGIHVVVNTIDLRCGTSHSIQWWLTYNQWAAQRGVDLDYSDNDIAMLRLYEKVTSKATPAQLSSLAASDFAGHSVTIAGWGKSNDGFNPRKMEMVEVTILTTTACENKLQSNLGRRVSLDPRLICSDSDPFGLLQPGDSGGPLIYRGTIIAVNRSTCPNEPYRNNNSKVNLHLSIQPFTTFIMDIKNNY